MTRKRRKTRSRQERAAIGRKLRRRWEARLEATLCAVIGRIWAEEHETATPWALLRETMFPYLIVDEIVVPR